MSEPVRQAFDLVFGDPQVILVVAAAAAYGVFMGAIPGLTATMAVALIVPLTYFLGPVPAIAAVVALEACAIFAGDVPTALLRIPGTPASAAYADDAYALTQRGEAERTLGVMLVFSVAGGLFGVLVLMLFAHPLANIAGRSFSAAEYFWLYLLGLSCAVVVSRGSNLKSALGLLIGLLLSTVGLSAVHPTPRFTFGSPELLAGVNFIPAMIGLFGLSEIFRCSIALSNESAEAQEPAAAERRPVFGPAVKLLGRRWPHALRSGGVGSLVGMLPGAGADIGAWVSIAASKRFSKTPEEYGRGSIDGISDATAANSSALAGAWIPALVFGIPGDTVTAIVIGVLMMKNVTPGPEIFEKQAPLVYSIYLMFILANLVLLPVGWLAIRLGSQIVRVPRNILLPVILMFCVVGSYAINGRAFDVGVMLAMGVVGFLLERKDVPLAPVVLGIILGGPLEERFIQTMTAAQNSPVGFFNRPVACGLGAACLLLWTTPVVAAWLKRRSHQENSS